MRVYSVKGAQWISNPQIAEFDSPYPLQKENMFNILSLFKKEKWALVKSLKCINGTVVYHIHLFESSSGKRKAEFNRNGDPHDPTMRDGWLKTQDIYQLQVYRWLHGRMDPNIPRYDQIPEDDTANYLKGSV